MKKVLLAALKDKKPYTTIMKGNLQLNYLNKPKKNKKKEHLISVISSIRVGTVSSVLERLTVALLVSF